MGASSPRCFFAALISRRSFSATGWNFRPRPLRKTLSRLFFGCLVVLFLLLLFLHVFFLHGSCVGSIFTPQGATSCGFESAAVRRKTLFSDTFRTLRANGHCYKTRACLNPFYRTRWRRSPHSFEFVLRHDCRFE